MNERNAPATFTTEDKQHLDWVYKLHRYGVPIAFAVLAVGFVWWRKQQRGPSLR